jgi:iron(III) transport system permease protein
MWGLRSSRTLVIGAAFAVFVVCCVLPLAYMLAASLSAAGGSDYRALLLDGRQRRLLYDTAVLGAGTSVVGTLIGAPLGIALARIDLKCKSLLRILLSAPMLLPPYVVGLSWVFLSDRDGGLAQILGRDVLSNWTYSRTSAMVLLGLVFYPLSMLTTEVAVRRIEPRLEEAALIVARPARVLRHITVRLAAPSIAAAALVIFVLAVSEFGLPGLLRVRVFTTEVFTAFASLYDFGRATVLALPLLFLSMIAAAVAVALEGERLITTRRGGANGPLPLLDAWKPAALVAAGILLVVALVVPLAMLLKESSAVRSWDAVISGSGAAIRNSILLASIGATLTVAVGLALGYARARASHGVGVMADLTLVIVFAVPSTVVGVGLIGLWNRAGAAGAVYGTDAMVLLVCFARFLPVAALGLAAAARQVPLSHEEAAAAAGAGWLRTVGQILVPQMLTSLLAVGVVVFVLAFGELSASILVAPPGDATLPIRIYTLIANAPPADVAALALLQSAVIVSPLLLLAAGIALREAR